MSARRAPRQGRCLAAALLALGLAVAPAHAGRSCEGAPPTVEAITRGLALAERLREALDASGARVAIVARAGQDLSRYGLTWSHAGIAYRTRGPDGEDAWQVLHKLNHCGTETASLYRHGLGQFFLDDPHRFEAAWLPIAEPLASRLLERLTDDRAVAHLHEPRYSVVAYPFAATYQQSNQWLLETLIAVADPSVRSRRDAQRRLQESGYRPVVLEIDAMTRLGARLTRANVAFDDHPNEKRFGNRIETVSVESVFAFVFTRGWAGRGAIGHIAML